MSESSSSHQQHPGAEAEGAAAAPHSAAYVGVPGVRFVPSDQELIIDYLWRKLLGHKPPTDLVQEADVYEEHPKDLTRRLGKSVEGFWYVFSTRNRKYAKGKRPSRSTGTAGRWKAVGKNEAVYLDPDKKENTIGHKCGLAYELFVRDEGSSSSRPQMEKTEWKMCEFVAEDTNRPISSAPGHMLLNDWVLCRIARKAAAAVGQVAVLEDHGQAALVDDEPHEDEQPQTAPPLDPSQLAQAVPMPTPNLLHDGADGSYVTEEVRTAGFDADLEPPPRDGDVAATDVQFDDDWSYRMEFWGDGGGAGSEFVRAFDHEQWNVDQFGPTSDTDPMLNQFQVLATDPDPVLSPLDVLPADPQSWDIASTLLFSDDGHMMNSS